MAYGFRCATEILHFLWRIFCPSVTEYVWVPCAGYGTRSIWPVRHRKSTLCGARRLMRHRMCAGPTLNYWAEAHLAYFCGAPWLVRHRNSTFCVARLWMRHRKLGFYGAPAMLHHRIFTFCGASTTVRHRKVTHPDLQKGDTTLSTCM